MKKVVAYVYAETDYTQFKSLDENRSVRESRVKRLMESIEEGEVLNPIVVNQEMEIIDGQGRFEAKKRLGLPIYYVVDKNADIEDCRRMNAFNTKWTMMDYIRSYARGGNENYQRLLSVAKEFNRSATVVTNLTGMKNMVSAGGETVNYLKSGALEFSAEDMERTRLYLRQMNEILEALNCPDKVSKPFATACRIVMGHKDYNHATMIKNCKQNRAMFVTMTRSQDQVKEFEDIYNYRLRKQNMIFFTDYYRRSQKAREGLQDKWYQGDFIDEEKDVSTLKDRGEKYKE